MLLWGCRLPPTYNECHSRVCISLQLVFKSMSINANFCILFLVSGFQLNGTSVFLHIETETKWPPFLQTTMFSNALSSFKIIVFRFLLHWNLFIKVQLKLKRPALCQAIIWINGVLVYCRIYASIGHNGLTDIFTARTAPAQYFIIVYY